MSGATRGWRAPGPAKSGIAPLPRPRRRGTRIGVCWETSTAHRPRSRLALGMPRCVITRRVHFNAAHRLHNPRWSEAENERVFGLCNSPNFHGHNYNLDVSVEGEIDPETEIGRASCRERG